MYRPLDYADPRRRAATWAIPGQQGPPQEDGFAMPPFSAPATSVNFSPDSLGYEYRGQTLPFAPNHQMLSYHHEQIPAHDQYYARSYGAFGPDAQEHHLHEAAMMAGHDPRLDHSLHHGPHTSGSYERNGLDSSTSLPEYDMRHLQLMSPHAHEGLVGHLPYSMISAERSSSVPENNFNFELPASRQLNEAGPSSAASSRSNSNGVNNYARLAKEATFTKPPDSPTREGEDGATDIAGHELLRMANGDSLASPGLLENEGFKMNSHGTPFISKLIHLLSNDKYRDYIRWNKAGDAFILSHTNQYFASHVLPIFFRHSNCASFIRQLNLYQFQRLPIMQLLTNLDDEGTGNLGTTAPSSCFSGFSHPHFRRGDEESYHLIKPKAATKSRERPGKKGKGSEQARERAASASQAGPVRSGSKGGIDSMSPRSAFHPYIPPLPTPSDSLPSLEDLQQQPMGSPLRSNGVPAQSEPVL